MHKVVRFVAFTAVLGFVAWCIVELQADLARLSLGQVLHAWQPVVLATLLSLLNYALRSVRWRVYLRMRGHVVPFGFATLTYVAGFAFTLSPGKLGELARARYYTRIGVPFADIAAVVFMERLMDLLAMIVLAALILTAFPRYGAALWIATGLVLLVLTLLALLPWARIANASRGSARFGAGAIAGTAETLAAARSLLRPQAIFTGFAIALVAWGVEGVGLYLLCSLDATGPIGLPGAIGTYSVAVLAGAFSFLPGGLGSTEAVMTALLVAQGYAISAAVLITLVCRIVTLWLAVGLGWIAALVLRRYPFAMALSCR